MNKYNAIKTTVDGITFDSRAEATRYAELRLMQRAGVITGLERQKRYVLIPKSRYGPEICYNADFVYLENGEVVVEDVKSKATATPLYKLKKRLMAERYDIKIKEIYNG